MADPQFFTNHGPFSIADIAHICDAEVDNSTKADLLIKDVASLDSASENDLSFLDNAKYKDDFAMSKAGAIIVHPDIAKSALAQNTPAILLVSNEPYKSYALAAAHFYPETVLKPFNAGEGAKDTIIHETAVISQNALIANGCEIHAHVVIEAGAEIGAGTIIGAGSFIGANTKIGAGCVVSSNCSIQFALIGDAVRIHDGVRIGQDGFGFALTSPPKGQTAGFAQVPQLGRVVIGDHVHIGANTTIDRGTGPDTIIGAGCILDNLVQIAHNVQLGQGCVLAAHVGISGSTTLGNYCMLGGQVGLAGHLKIGHAVRIGAQSGVMNSLEDKAEVQGSPAQEKKAYWRELAMLRRLLKKKN